MAAYVVTNNAYSTLASSVLIAATTLTVQAGHGARFPAISAGDFTFITLQDSSNYIEIVKVTARSTDTFTIVRAQEGTSARAWASGDTVELRFTAGTAATVDGTQTFSNKTLTSPTVTGTLTGAAATFSADSAFTSTGALQLPASTTANRPTGASGKIRYNTTTGSFEGYAASSWGTIGGGATGAGGDTVFQENSLIVTTSYTLSTGKSAMSVGPITINSGATVTIPSGYRWLGL